MKKVDIEYVKCFELIDKSTCWPDEAYKWYWTRSSKTGVGNTTYGICDHFSNHSSHL